MKIQPIISKVVKDNVVLPRFPSATIEPDSTFISAI